MISSEVLQITQQALWLVVILAGPPVVVAALVGILIAFIQAATQLQEQTFQYAAKFFAIVVTIFLTASLIGSSLFRFSDRIFSDFPSLVG
ncbi:MAG: type III secretion system export apparatus subunit SctS [Granulosicoccus sp.]